MTDLDTGFLERWAELEPERCKAFPRHATVQVKGKWNPAEFTGTILAAVIEAIEARGWEWTLWSDGREREATVHIQDDDPKQPRRNHGTDLTTDQPAAALLTAYLAALEAEAGQ